jgi:hypothetical protein
MEPTKLVRIRAARFLSDRYAYRTQPNCLCEFIAFGIVVVTAVWPILLLGGVMPLTLK